MRQLLTADAAQRANDGAQSFLRMAYDRIAPPFTRLQELKVMMEQRVESVSTRVPEMINEEVEAAMGEIRATLQMPLPDTRFNLNDHMPSLTMLLAGLSEVSHILYFTSL